jgi:pimeloyl-ACP methyl ester carboxylesterase
MTSLPPDFLPPTPRRRLTLHRPDGVRIAVQLHGPDDAPTVVLAHGWTCSATFWNRVTHRLLGDHRVVVFDQRGHGRSSTVPDGGFTTDALAGDLAAVLRATVPAEGKAVVAGHSMGAMAMVALAGTDADTLHATIGAAVLASTGVEELVGRLNVLPVNREPDERWLAFARAAMADPRGLPRLPLSAARAVTTRVTLSRTATRAEREFTTDIVLACPVATFRGFALMLGEVNLRKQLDLFDVPTTVLVGTHDRLTPPWHAHRMADALPFSLGLVELPGEGHMTPLTAPDQVAGVVRRLARGHAGRFGPAVGWEAG